MEGEQGELKALFILCRPEAAAAVAATPAPCRVCCPHGPGHSVHSSRPRPGRCATNHQTGACSFLHTRLAPPSRLCQGCCSAMLHVSFLQRMSHKAAPLLPSAVASLMSFPTSLEPAATGRWVAHAAVVGALIQQAVALPVGLRSLAER